MNLFIRLLAGHVVGDFLLQTGRIAEVKRIGPRGLAYHTLLVVAATTLFVLPTPHMEGRWAMVLLAVAAVHMSIDAVRTFLVRDLKRHNTLYFFVDQGIHTLSLMLISYAQRPEAYPSLWAFIHPRSNLERFYLAVTGIIVLVFAIPVLEALIGMDLGVMRSGGQPQVTVRMRALGALERTIGLTLMLTPYAYLMPLVFVPHFLYRLLWKEEDLPAYNLLRPTLSFLSTCIIGWLVRNA